VRRSNWTPSIVPRGDGHDVYLAVDDLGRLGRVWREAHFEATDFETVVTDLLEGQYKNPIGISALNAVEGWSRDVSADIAIEPASALRSSAGRRAGPSGPSSIETMLSIGPSFRCRCAWHDDQVRWVRRLRLDLREP
jgi:hypothetical protein